MSFRISRIYRSAGATKTPPPPPAFTRKQWASMLAIPTVVVGVPSLAYAYASYQKEVENNATGNGDSIEHTSKGFLRWLFLKSPFSSIAETTAPDPLVSPRRDWSAGPPIRRTPMYIAGGSEDGDAVARHGKLPPLSDPRLEIGEDLHTVLQNQKIAKKQKPLMTRAVTKVKLAFDVWLQVTRIVLCSIPVIFYFVMAYKFPDNKAGIDTHKACIALQQLLITLGPTYVKLGQWMGTRHDLFPKEICHYLSVLCDKAPTHEWEHTLAELKAQRVVRKEKVKVPRGLPGGVAVNTAENIKAVKNHVAVPPASAITVPDASLVGDAKDGSGKAIIATDEIEVEVEESLIDYLESVDREPINSGSVAQVHHAILKRDVDGIPAGTHLAIKVLHPRVREQIWVDVWVLRILARGLEFFYAGCRFADPMVHWYEFSSLLLSQLNFEREADNMDRFQYNFRNLPQVVFPTAIRTLTNADVLVETFEIGWKMEDVVVTKKMADLGVRMFLKMIFEDNFLHADLHQGNVLVRRRCVTNGTFTNDLTEGSDLTHVNEIVVLDPGLVTTLSSYDRETVLTTFAAVACGDSDLTAEIALARSPSNNCQDTDAFKRDVGEIFKLMAPHYNDPLAWARTGFKMGDIQIGDVMMDTLDRMKKHHVSIDGHFASLMTAMIVGEAMGKKMNPEYNIFSAAAPYLMTALDGSDLKFLVTKLREVYGQTSIDNKF